MDKKSPPPTPNRHTEEVAMLIAEAGPLHGQRWTLGAVLVVGRDSRCDLVISDRQVSRRHAYFTSQADGVYLEDLNSKNGTHVNGQPIQGRVLLQDGDAIQIALVQSFTFISSDATAPLELQETEMRKLPVESSPPRRLYLDSKAHRVWVFSGEQDVEILPPLSASQFRLLEKLYQNQSQVIPRRDLAAVVWGEKEAYTISEQALDALVRRLRERIAEIDSRNTYIITVRGHGLRLDNPAR